MLKSSYSDDENPSLYDKPIGGFHIEEDELPYDKPIGGFHIEDNNPDYYEGMKHFQDD